MQKYPGKPKTKRCEWCGEKFQTTKDWQRFCRESHRVRMAQERKLAESK